MRAEMTTVSLYERVLVDDALSAYVEWREECRAVRACHELWRTATRGQAVLDHARYQAALDREEAAAGAYAERLERVRELLARHSKLER
jgi:hypothetical protein